VEVVQLLVGFLVGAVVVALLLRPAARWVGLVRVSYDEAMKVSLIATALGLVPAVLAQGIALSTGGSMWVWAGVRLLLLPLNWLILSVTIGRYLGLRPLTAGLVALLVYALLVAVVCAALGALLVVGVVANPALP
jgi:hypothetical protein